MINENDLQLKLNTELTNNKPTLALTTNEIKLIKKINDPIFFQTLLKKNNKTTVTISTVKDNEKFQANIPVDWARDERIGGNIFERIITPNTGFAIFLGFAQLSEKNSVLVYFNEANAAVIGNPYVNNEEVFKQRQLKFSGCQKTELDWTELHKIVSFGDLEELKALLSKQDSTTLLTKATNQSSTPLDMAIWRGLPDRVECLLEKVVSDGRSLTIAFQKYSETKQEPHLQICIALIKNMLKNKDSLKGLKKNDSYFILDLPSPLNKNKLEVNPDTLPALCELENNNYIFGLDLRLRQIVLSQIIVPLQSQQAVPDQEALFAKEPIIAMSKELSTSFSHRISQNLFSGLWAQFAVVPNFVNAHEAFKNACQSNFEAYIFLGYQFATGKGQRRDYNKAGQHYFDAFTKTNKELTVTPNDEDDFYRSFLLDLEAAAVSFLQNLYQQTPPTLEDKAHIALLLAKCYSQQNADQKIAELVEITHLEYLQDEKLAEFKKIAACAYFQLTKNRNNKERQNFLEKARIMGHGTAALILGEMAINQQPQSDFFTAVSYFIDALTATCHINIEKAVAQCLTYIDILCEDKSHEEKMNEMVFKAASTILKKMQSSNDKWPTYKSFFQQLLARNNLPEKSKLDIEYALFSCYQNGREVTIAELEISPTKNFGLFATKKSATDIETEKQQKITNKLNALEKQDPSIAERFPKMINESKELDGQVTIPLYPLVETPVPYAPTSTAVTQKISIETPKEPNLSEQKISQLEMKLTKAKTELEELKNENDALKKATQKLDDSDLLKKENSELKIQFSELKIQLSKYQKEVAGLKLKLEKPQAMSSKFSQSNTKWQRLPKIELIKEAKNSKDEQNDPESSSPMHDSVTLNF